MGWLSKGGDLQRRWSQQGDANAYNVDFKWHSLAVGNPQSIVVEFVVYYRNISTRLACICSHSAFTTCKIVLYVILLWLTLAMVLLLYDYLP